jgi:hypothetical protein
MSNNSTGGKLGLISEATIDSYNGDGTVNLSVPTNPNKIIAALPLAFTSTDGAFIGGYPSIGTSVSVSHGQGRYFITSYLPTNKIFNGTSGRRDLMSEFTPGRILLQTKNASNRILMDPNEGIEIGTSIENSHADPSRGIWSHNFRQELHFSAGHRSIIGPIQRDIKENSTRNVTSSILDSHEYSDSLAKIGMDPSTTPSTNFSGNVIRNLPLIENHEITYEFQNYDNGIGFTTDTDEGDRYVSKLLPDRPSSVLRKDSRTDAFNLSLNNPNHLIEVIKGTGTDIYSNILDLNRDILPIGKTNKLSLSKNPDKKDAFARIRALHRKGLAFHFEINARKQTGNDDVSQAPNPTSVDDYGRLRSRFFFDVDKEGQFKMNVPASSETGNVPVLARYETASTIAASMGLITDPNQFIKEGNNRDIFHQGFANAATISLKGDSDGDSSPNDVILNTPIKLGTAYHDIRKTILVHQTNTNARLLNYFKTSETYLNRIAAIDQEDIVSDTVIVSGASANSGGRSGTMNFDGSLSMSIGANTVDRQSLWLDLAGGFISNIGRDLNGHSVKSSFNGDVLLEIGGVGVIGDSRFAKENNALRAGTFDLRVIDGTGQLSMIRIDKNGIFISSAGRLEINSAQDMILRSKGNLMLQGENVIVYPDDGQARIIKRSGVVEI